MGRYKFSGVNGAKAAKTEARRFEVYDGPTPPRGPYLVKVGRMTIGANKNGDGMITTQVIIDEPTKKDGKTNPKARYNGAPAWDRQNVTEESAGYVNSFLESLGCTPTDITNFWKMGPVTEDDPNQADREIIKQLGKVKVANAHALCLMGMGQASTRGGKTYDARFEVQSWLVSNQLVGSGSDLDEDEDVEDEDVEADEEEVEEAEADEEDEEDEEPEDDEEFTARQVELEGMTRVQLKKAATAAKLDMKVTAKTKDEDIVAAILDKEFPLADEEEEEPEDEEEPEEEEDEGDELDEATRLDLKRILKDEGIEFRVLKTTSDDQLREAIRAARGGAEEDEDEEDEPEEDATPAKPVRGRRSKGAGEPPF